MKQNDSRSNSPKMIEVKFAQIINLINRGTLRAALRAELPGGSNKITARCVLANKSNKDKEEK